MIHYFFYFSKIRMFYHKNQSIMSIYFEFYQLRQRYILKYPADKDRALFKYDETINILRNNQIISNYPITIVL